MSATKDPNSLLGSLVKLCVYCYNCSFFFMMADDEDIPANFPVDADGGYNCRQMLYCLPIHILAQ
jgi:hypothetical protein